MSKNRLSKHLMSAGIASRRACEVLIAAGRVKVNGVVELLPQTMVDWNDQLTVDDKPVVEPQNKVYFILNKPEGYICTARSNNTTKIVLDLFQGIEERLFTVGRLDKDTKGLIIVTNDGHFANSVIHPSANIAKEYLAKTNAEISAEHLKAIASGTLVEGIFVKPSQVLKVRKGTVKITVHEGKKREVRLLLENAGIQVLELTRIRIGGLHLGQLAEGTWRVMTEREREVIFE